MKTLELNQMETTTGGDWFSENACAISIVGAGAALIGLASLTAASGGLAIAGAFVGWDVAIISVGSNCDD